MNITGRKRPFEVSIRKIKHLNTGEKEYLVYIGSKLLRLSWRSKTRAEAYGKVVKNRYIKKLNIEKN